MWPCAPARRARNRGVDRSGSPNRRRPTCQRAVGARSSAVNAEQCAANAALLIAGQYVSVTNEIDVAHRLKSHHADEPALLLIAPERYAGGDLLIELRRWHVGNVPSIGGDHPAIGFGSSIDDREDRRTLAGVAGTDAGTDAVHDQNVIQDRGCSVRYQGKADVTSTEVCYRGKPMLPAGRFGT